MFRPIDVSSPDGSRKETAVALIDTGCDETVINQSVAERLHLEQYGEYRSVSASQHEVHGYYSEVVLRDLREGVGGIHYVGVTNVPFDSDEGIVAIIGVDFLQAHNIKLDFSS